MAKPVIEAYLDTRGPGGKALGTVSLAGGDGPLTEVHLSVDGTVWVTSGTLTLPGYGTIVVDPDGFLPADFCALEGHIDPTAEVGYYSFQIRAVNAQGQMSDPITLNARVALPISGAPAGAVGTYDGLYARRTFPDGTVEAFDTAGKWVAIPGASPTLGVVVYNVPVTSDSIHRFRIIDLTDGSTVKEFPIYDAINDLTGAYGTGGATYLGGDVWVVTAGSTDSGEADEGLWRINLTTEWTQLVANESALGVAYATSITNDGTYLYVLDAVNNRVSKIDPSDYSVVSTFGVNSNTNRNIAYIDGRLWAWRGGQLRVYSTDGEWITEYIGSPAPTSSDTIRYIFQHGRYAYALVTRSGGGTELRRADLDNRAAGWTTVAGSLTEAGYVDSNIGTEARMNLLTGFVYIAAKVGNRIVFPQNYTEDDSRRYPVRYIELTDGWAVYPPGEESEDPAPLTSPLPTSLELDSVGAEKGYWVYQETDEGGVWELDVYTTDPEGTATGVRFEVYDDDADEWRTTPVVSQTTQPIDVYFWADSGKPVRAGQLEILQAYTGHDAPPGPDVAAATAKLRLTLDPWVYGTFDYTVENDPDYGDYLDFKGASAGPYPTWFASRFGFPGVQYPVLLTVRATEAGGRTSAPVTIRLGVAPVPNGPSVPKPRDGDPTETVENVPISGRLVCDYPGDFTDDGENFLAILANPDPDAAFNDANWSTSITCYDDEGEVLGTLTLSGSPSKSNPSVGYTFTPATNKHGNTTVAVMADSGDNSIVAPGDTPTGFALGTLTFRVGEVNQAPSAPSPTTIPAFDEDGYVDHIITWTDPDIVDPEEDTGSWEVQLSAVGPNGPWRTDYIDLPEARVIIDPDDEYEDSDLESKLRILGRAGVHGPYAFWGRILDRSGDPELYSPVVKFTGTIDSVPDTPASPVPTRMPTIRKGEELAVGTFTTVDPDEEDTSWTFTVSASSSGPWSSSASLGSAVGVVTVLDTDTSDKQAQVAFAPDPDFSGRYHFWLRVTDSSGLTSAPRRIVGAVAADEAFGELVKVTRSSGGVSFEPLCPVTFADIRITESLTGPGGAVFHIPARQVATRAAALGMTYEELLEPDHIEIHLYQDGVKRYAGVISRPTRRIDNALIEVETKGLASYLDRRLNEATRSYINNEQTEVMWDLVYQAQLLPYGDLGFTDGTVPTTVNFDSLEFGADQFISECLEELSSRMNGAEWWVDPDRIFRAQALRGSDRRGQIIFTEKNTVGLTDSTEGGDIATVALVTGDEVEGTYQASAAQLAKYGRPGRHTTAAQLGTSTACEALAKEIVEKRGAAQPTARFTHIAKADSPIGQWSYEVGDAVTIEAQTQAGEFACDVRIINRRLRLVPGSENDWRIDLEVERIADDGVIRRARSRHGYTFMNEVYDRLYVNPA